MTIQGNLPRGAPGNRFTLLICLILVALAFAIWREVAHLSPPPPPGTNEPKTPPLISTTIITPHNTSGLTFTIDEPRQAYITINRYTGGHIVINKLDGPVIYTFKKKNFEGERHFDQGTYVISLAAETGKVAKAFIEVR